MDHSGACTVPESGELALQRPTRLRLGGVEDDVRGAKVRPVGAKQLDCHRVLGGQGASGDGG